MVIKHAHDKGNLDKFIAPIDAAHQFCGFSKGYENYKYLLVYPESKEDKTEYRVWFERAVCVKACPTHVG